MVDQVHHGPRACARNAPDMARIALTQNAPIADRFIVAFNQPRNRARTGTVYERQQRFSGLMFADADVYSERRRFSEGLEPAIRKSENS